MLLFLGLDEFGNLQLGFFARLLFLSVKVPWLEQGNIHTFDSSVSLQGTVQTLKVNNFTLQTLQSMDHKPATSPRLDSDGVDALDRNTAQHCTEN